MPTTEPHRPPHEYSVTLSRHLRDYMTENGLSVERLATALGRSRNYVYDHTSGQRAPDLDLLATVARLTGTDARSLMLTLMGRMGSGTAKH